MIYNLEHKGEAGGLRQLYGLGPCILRPNICIGETHTPQLGPCLHLVSGGCTKLFQMRQSLQPSGKQLFMRFGQVHFLCIKKNPNPVAQNFVVRQVGNF